MSYHKSPLNRSNYKIAAESLNLKLILPQRSDKHNNVQLGIYIKQICRANRYTVFAGVTKTGRVSNLDKVLADIHGISTSTTSRMVLSWVNYLYVNLGSMLLWPSRQTVDAHMPDVFKDKYRATLVILDVLIFIFISGTAA